eukprot:COSAG05_NODE_1289_length_5268_cov_4.125943_3_plen_285_part_01
MALLPALVAAAASLAATAPSAVAASSCLSNLDGSLGHPARACPADRAEPWPTEPCTPLPRWGTSTSEFCAPRAVRLKSDDALPAPASVLAAAKQALAHWSAANAPSAATCSWTDSTLMLGAIEYYKASQDAAALQGVRAWAEHNHFRVCGSKATEPQLDRAARLPPTTHGTSPFPPPPPGDDSCGVSVRGVAYVGNPTGKNFSAGSFGDCCGRCQQFGWQKCTYFTYYPPAAHSGAESTSSGGGSCSFQGSNAQVMASPSALSGWPSGGPCPPQCRHVPGGVRGP